MVAVAHLQIIILFIIFQRPLPLYEAVHNTDVYICDMNKIKMLRQWQWVGAFCNIRYKFIVLLNFKFEKKEKENKV